MFTVVSPDIHKTILMTVICVKPAQSDGNMCANYIDAADIDFECFLNQGGFN